MDFPPKRRHCCIATRCERITIKRYIRIAWSTSTVRSAPGRELVLPGGQRVRFGGSPGKWKALRLTEQLQPARERVRFGGVLGVGGQHCRARCRLAGGAAR